MTITIIVLIVTIAMFIWGRVRGDIVALSALMVLTATIIKRIFIAYRHYDGMTICGGWSHTANGIGTDRRQ